MARITISDVAKRAGVSSMTVSRVLNHKGEISFSTRKLVQQAIDELDYRPSTVARSLKTNRTMTIGMIIPDVTNPFFPEIVRGVEDTAWAQNYTMVLCNTAEDRAREEATLRLLEANRVDGVILCSPRLSDEQLLPLLKRHSATVLVNRTVPGTIFDTVQVDDAYGTMCAVQHLLRDGRQVIGCLAGPSYSYSGQKRVQGFITALESKGHIFNPDLVVNCSPNEEGGFKASKELLTTHPEIDGLICYDDMVAIGALQACVELNTHIPSDIAVIGCDDVRYATLVTPALTTLRISKYDIGASASRMLLENIEGRSSQKEKILTPELIIRASAP